MFFFQGSEYLYKKNERRDIILMRKLKAILMILALAFALTGSVVLPYAAHTVVCYAEPPELDLELTGH